MAYMAYSHYMEQGRLPSEVDDMNMEDYIGILRFRAFDKQRDEEPKEKYIEDFI